LPLNPVFYGPSDEPPLPVATRCNAMFLFLDPKPQQDDEAVVRRIASALAPEGFTAAKMNRGSIGTEAVLSVSRGRSSVEISCELNEPMCESQLRLEPHRPWFWQRALRIAPRPEDVEAALAAIQEAANKVLNDTPAVSALVWRSSEELAAFFKHPPRGNSSA
jgi:hypothetical protein